MKHNAVRRSGKGLLTALFLRITYNELFSFNDQNKNGQ